MKGSLGSAAGPRVRLMPSQRGGRRSCNEKGKEKKKMIDSIRFNFLKGPASFPVLFDAGKGGVDVSLETALHSRKAACTGPERLRDQADKQINRLTRLLRFAEAA